MTPLQLPEFVYHLVREAQFTEQTTEDHYTPADFEPDGFIHCTSGEEMTMRVARRIFGGAGDVLLLRIRLSQVTAPVKFEEARPKAGEQLPWGNPSAMFVHIYGSLNLNAVEGIARLAGDASFPKFPPIHNEER